MNEQQRAVVQQALDALGEIYWSNDTQWQSDRAKVAITALRQLLEQQPVQEPQAYLYKVDVSRTKDGECAKYDHPIYFPSEADASHYCWTINQAQPKDSIFVASCSYVKIATPPAQPAAWDYDALHGAWLFIGADLAGLKWEDFEAKLREKNGGKA
jgi:hypothetical protein